MKKPFIYIVTAGVYFMQPILPSNLDRTSAQVLGFDAQAYLSDTPSALHQRLGVPGSFNSADYFMSSDKNKTKKKKSNALLQVVAVTAVAAGVGIAGYLGFKKLKIKMPEIKSVKELLPKAKSFVGKTFGKIKTAALGVVEKIKNKIPKKS